MVSEQPVQLTPTSPQTLARLMIGALVTAVVVLICFVLPAEYRIDPTGIGRATGVIRLAGARRIAGEAVGAASTQSAIGAPARYYAAEFRSDFVDIPLNASGTRDGKDELEYKVRMKAGSAFVYSWTVEGVSNPEAFYFDFHGEAPPATPDGVPTVVELRQTTGLQSHGELTAPLDGVWGWYLQNQSEAPAVVHLKLAGFYELIPPGEYGNKAAIAANKTLAP